MHKVSRREVLLGGAALVGAAASGVRGATNVDPLVPEVGKVDLVATDVYFHEGNLAQGNCNNGWIIFDDFVLVIDANTPGGAKTIIPKIQALTNKPIRFALDTHHHWDHAYGNHELAQVGAIPFAHNGVLEEMKKYETGHYGNKPGAWEELAARRPDVKASKFKPPSLVFPREIIFDDGKHRVEVIHLGTAHTIGDSFAWLPKEKILFSGDACVNGPYNYMGDGDSEKWIATLEAAKKLGAQIVCPGHGPRDAAGLLSDQQAFFKALREQVNALVKARKTSEQVKSDVNRMKGEIAANGQYGKYAKGLGVSFEDQVEKVYHEMTGKNFPETQRTGHDSRIHHAHSHGTELIHS